MAEYDLVLDKVLSGKAAKVKLWFVVTDIGDEDDPENDCYLFKVRMPDAKKSDAREGLELKPKDKTTVGDVTWTITDVDGEEPDPKDPDGDRMITTYKFKDVVFKTFEDENKYSTAKVTVTHPFEAVLATDDWVD